MLRSKHTPGPWSLGANEEKEIVVRAESCDGKPHLCKVLPVAGRDFHEVPANGCLIAAAPELLAALEDVLAATNLKGSGHPLETKALEAIKKAKGE